MNLVDEKDLIVAIKELKKKLGPKTVILGHHYQRESIIEVSDFVGDSFALAKKAAEEKNVEQIIFCGVHFMAEAASILSPNAKVYIPDPNAGCPMADMAKEEDVEKVFNFLQKNEHKKIIPITYMNSSAAIKAFCGEHEGVVCTSSNSTKIFKHILDKGHKILFMPDEHLGKNTAYKLDIEEDEITLVSPILDIDKDKIKNSKIFLWKGFCHVHTWFTVEQVESAREKFPDAIVIVHPECPKDVVNAADEDGSTEKIVNFVNEAESGSVIFVGTEINLVSRLAKTHPDKKIYPLSRSLCPNMFKISPKKLLETLKNFPEDNLVKVDSNTAQNAKKALDKMIELAS